VRPEEHNANRRRHRRVPLQSRCWCETEGITLYARAMNVSEGGVFIRTYAPLQQGSPAKVRFVAEAGGREIAADAVVVWVREAQLEQREHPGMGLQFVSIDEPSVRTLREYIDRSGETGR
jgi:uncharacterized protein (TIGR02266 family)